MIPVLFCSLLSFVSAQYENQPLNLQPIPIILQLPDMGQQNFQNLQYSVLDNGKNEENRDRVTYDDISNWNSNLRRRDDPAQVPNKISFPEERARSARYQERYDSYYPRQHEKSSRGYQTSRSSNRRQKRPRYSTKDALSVHRNILWEEKGPSTAEIRRSPRVVKYIADKNGFAIREDLVQSFQDSNHRSKHRPRILMAGSSPLMSHVVTSAIQVTNHLPSSGGKYVPQIIDMKVGKR